MSTGAGADARITLLSGLIDDAGLFPPAELSMADAVAAHQHAEAGDYAWIQGRFLCPVERLEELLGALPAGVEWPLAVIGGEPAAGALDEVFDAAVGCQRRSAGRLRLEAIELRLPPDPVDVAALLRAAAAAARRARPDGPVELYVEAPLGGSWLTPKRTAAAVAEVRRWWPDGPSLPPGAKIRCGGSPDIAASTQELAAFIGACAAGGVPFKATAGLHHPLAHVDSRTGAAVHGFLNLAAATALLAGGALSMAELGQVLDETNPGALELSAYALTWRDRRVGSTVLARVRRERLRSYGSCSFDEPTEDLEALGVLPLEADVA